MAQHKIRKICLIGGESTGKTTLSRYLATTFDDVWVPEWARSYLDNRDFVTNPFVSEDFAKIAHNHWESVLNAERNAKQVVFVDTDAIITVMVASYKDVPDEVHNIANIQQYDLFLVMDPDVPYEADPQRFLPDLKARQDFHTKLLKELDTRGLQSKYEIISGNLEERKKRCVSLVQKLLQQ